MRNSRKVRKATHQTLSAEDATCQDCIEQGDICCEQARTAAKLKRFKAASGLFNTAQNLYQRACTLGGDYCTDARERLLHLSSEIAVYRDLAKGQSRPLGPPAPVAAPAPRSRERQHTS